MYYLNDATLAYYKAFNGLVPVDISAANMGTIVKAVNEYQKYTATEVGVAIEAGVEHEALLFYLLNHAFSELRAKYNEDANLPPRAQDLAATYMDLLANSGRRMFSYVLMIVTRESRHMLHKDHLAQGLSELIGEKAAKRYFKFRGKLPSSSDGAVAKLKSSPPNMTLGDYATAVEYIFDNAGWGGGYGGEPWGKIARTLRRYATGEYTMEMFMDTAWTLAHNNGPMFNKGLLYKHYDSDIHTILDVQSSGQIPHFISDIKKDLYNVEGANKKVLDLYDFVAEVLPDELGTVYMDWYRMNELGGAKKSYPGFEQVQVANYGDPQVDPAAEALKAELAVKHEAFIKELEASKYFVTEVEFVTKVDRKAVQTAIQMEELS
jgi:hypothetical protein